MYIYNIYVYIYICMYIPIEKGLKKYTHSKCTRGISCQSVLP